MSMTWVHECAASQFVGAGVQVGLQNGRRPLPRGRLAGVTAQAKIQIGYEIVAMLAICSRLKRLLLLFRHGAYPDPRWKCAGRRHTFANARVVASGPPSGQAQDLGCESEPVYRGVPSAAAFAILGNLLSATTRRDESSWRTQKC